MSGFFLTSCSLLPQNKKDSSLAPTANEQQQAQPVDNTQVEKGVDIKIQDQTSKSEVREITIDGSNFKFSQKTITVKAGETISLTFKNLEGFHDFVIDELDVKTKQLKAGESEVVTFSIPPDASGLEYEYYCSVGQHRQMGMVGTLVIE